MITERGGYLVPGGNQVIAVAAGDVDGRLDHVPDRRAGLLQRDPQVPERLAEQLIALFDGAIVQTVMGTPLQPDTLQAAVGALLDAQGVR